MPSLKPGRCAGSLLASWWRPLRRYARSCAGLPAGHSLGHRLQDSTVSRSTSAPWRSGTAGHLRFFCPTTRWGFSLRPRFSRCRCWGPRPSRRVYRGSHLDLPLEQGRSPAESRTSAAVPGESSSFQFQRNREVHHCGRKMFARPGSPGTEPTPRTRHRLRTRADQRLHCARSGTVNHTLHMRVGTPSTRFRESSSSLKWSRIRLQNWTTLNSRIALKVHQRR